MLGALRGAARTPIALIFIVLLAASFAVWGLSDVFAGRASGALVSAGQRHIYQADVERRVGYYLRNQRNEGNYTDRRSAVTDGTVQQIFDSMAQNLSLLETARNHGVTASKRGLARRIAASGGFGDPVTGEFDRIAYRQFLQSSGDSQKGFETALRDDMTMEYLRDVAGKAISPPEHLVRVWLLPYIENRSFAYVVVAAPDDIPEPDDQQIQAYYDDNVASYATPERREVSVFSLSADDYLHTVTVSEDDITAAYDRHGQSYAAPQQREIIEAVSENRAPLELLTDRINTGTSPDHALEGIDDQITQSVRIVSKDQIEDDQMLDAAFTIAQGQSLTPTRDQDTGIWKTLIVKRVLPADIPPLDDIRARLVDDIERERADDAFTTDRSESLIDLIGGGYPVEDIAAELGGVVTSYPAISSDGQSSDGLSIDALDSDILEAAFTLNQGETSTEIETDSTIRIVEVTRIIPSDITPLSEVRDQIRTAIIERERMESARSVALAVASQTHDPDSLRAAATDAGLTVHSYPDSISRYGSDADLDSDIVEAVFDLKPDKADILERPTGATMILLLTEVSLNNDQNLIEQYLRIGKSSLSGSLGSQLGSAARGVASRKTPARINGNAFEEYTRFLLGQSEPG